MVMICQQCGDEGFSNAYVYCVECLDIAIHRYCLHQIPKTFDEFVDWVCEDCESEGLNQSTLLKPRTILPLKRDHSSSESVEAICLRMVKKKKKKEESYEHGPSQKISKVLRERELECSQLTAERSPLMAKPRKNKDVTSYTSDKNELRHDVSPSQQPCDTHIELESTTRFKLVTSSPKEINLKRKNKDNTCLVAKRQDRGHLCHSSQQSLEAYSNQGLTNHAKLVRTCLTLKVKSHKIDNISRLEDGAKEKSSLSPSSSQQLYVAHTNLDFSNDSFVGDCSSMNREKRSIPWVIEKHAKNLDLEKESKLVIETGSNFDDEVSQLATAPNSIRHDYERPAEPVADPIWRGDFSVVNKGYDTFDGFVAHVSSKACSKVCEEASLLPSLLRLEMLPKSDVWPKSFQISEPSDESIALYFFPVDTRYERIFDHLVDVMMEEELAMKATVKNAELLVFTSTELPLLYWRFQGKYYLWGVFREKQDSRSQAMSQHIVVSNESKNAADSPSSANTMDIEGKRNLKRNTTLDADSPLSNNRSCV